MCLDEMQNCKEFDIFVEISQLFYITIEIPVQLK